MLTADAYGVLPPISGLTPEGAMYHFLSGIPQKSLARRKGVTEPRAALQHVLRSPVPPVEAGRLRPSPRREDRDAPGTRVAGEHRLDRGTLRCRSRMRIAHTRAMITAAFGGQLDAVNYRRHAVFNLDLPATCPGYRTRCLIPAARGRIQRDMTIRRNDWRACSSRTSRRSRST